MLDVDVLQKGKLVRLKEMLPKNINMHPRKFYFLNYKNHLENTKSYEARPSAIDSSDLGYSMPLAEVHFPLAGKNEPQPKLL